MSSNIAVKKMRLLRYAIVLSPAFVALACSDYATERMGSHRVRYWPGITQEQATATLKLVQEFNPSAAETTFSIWQEPTAVCVRVMNWNGHAYQSSPEKPGAPTLLSQRVFDSKPTCVGFEGDSAVAFAPECSTPKVFADCGHSLEARVAPAR